jgi:hypothetical protein
MASQPDDGEGDDDEHLPPPRLSDEEIDQVLNILFPSSFTDQFRLYFPGSNEDVIQMARLNLAISFSMIGEDDQRTLAGFMVAGGRASRQSFRTLIDVVYDEDRLMRDASQMAAVKR